MKRMASSRGCGRKSLNMLSSPLVDLAARAVTDADRTMLVEDDATLSFAQGHRHALALGSFLRLLGVAKGGRVAVLMAKSHKQAIAQLGVLPAGLVFVPARHLVKRGEVE